MATHKKDKTFKERLYAFVGINYEHKSAAYWYALAIPQLFLFIAILYMAAMVMASHVYGYIYPGKQLSFPGDRVLYYLGGEDIPKVEKKTIDTSTLESDLLSETMKEESLEAYKRFHNLATPVDTTEVDPICFICHGDYPHAANKSVRAILNMHIEFVACITCHYKGIPEEELEFKWYKPDHIKVTGKQYGLSYDPKTGGLTQTDDRFSKITPFAVINGVKQSLEPLGESAKARDYLKVRDKLTAAQQSKIKASFHTYAAPKGVFCDRCHTSKNGILDFPALGFEKNRARDLTGLNIVGVISKYKEFYIPNIYQTNPEGKFYKEEEPVYTDPRGWWRDRYVDKVGK